jgi:hypothetical protein
VLTNFFRSLGTSGVALEICHNVNVVNTLLLYEGILVGRALLAARTLQMKLGGSGSGKERAGGIDWRGTGMIVSKKNRRDGNKICSEMFMTRERPYWSVKVLRTIIVSDLPIQCLLGTLYVMAGD